jgi:hypothetical protein
MAYLTGTQYLLETRWVWVRVQMFTYEYRYGYEILPTTFVLPGGYLLYPTQTRPVAIPKEVMDEEDNE